MCGARGEEDNIDLWHWLDLWRCVGYLNLTVSQEVRNQNNSPRALYFEFHAPQLRQFDLRHYGQTPSIKLLGKTRDVPFVSIMNCSGGFYRTSRHPAMIDLRAKTLVARDVPLLSLAPTLRQNVDNMTLVIVSTIACPRQDGLEIQPPSLRNLSVFNSAPNYVLPLFTETQGRFEIVATHSFAEGSSNLLNGLIKRNFSRHKLKSLVIDADLPLRQQGQTNAHPTLSTSDLAIIASCIRLQVLVLKGCFFGHLNKALLSPVNWWKASGVLDTLRTWLWPLPLPPLLLLYCGFVPNFKSDNVDLLWAPCFAKLTMDRTVHEIIMEGYDYRILSEEYDHVFLGVMEGIISLLGVVYTCRARPTTE